MLSFIPAPPLYATQHAHRFAPPIPSPLAARDPNTLPPSVFQNPLSKPFNMTTSTTAEPSKHSVFQPVSRLSPSPVATINARASKDKRREKFFAKNRKQREETRFEGRSEIGLRKAFVDERRQWEDRLTREAPSMEIWEDGEEADAMDEDEMMEGEESPPEDDEFGELGDIGEEGKRDSQEFYDEEYESIFAEIAGRERGEIEEGAMTSSMDKPSGETRTESQDSEGARETMRQEESHDMDMTD